ncbi:MAG: HisA/HisF-related TIM barrel protein [Thermoplasmatota archaeon]
MNIIPAIDLRHGNVVQLVQGNPDNVGVQGTLSPKAQAAAWIEAGATRLHVVDLDAAFEEKPQSMQIQSILRAGAPVQLGGGFRHMLDIQMALNGGADRIIVGTQGVQHPDWLREVAQLFPGRILLAVDAKGRNVVTKGWTEETGKDVVELAASLTGCGLAGFLYTNVDKEGLMQGIDVDVLRDLRAAIQEELIASGGFATTDDLVAAKDAGVDAVVLGMSIYTGSLTLQAAMEAVA